MSEADELTEDSIGPPTRQLRRTERKLTNKRLVLDDSDDGVSVTGSSSRRTSREGSREPSKKKRKTTPVPTAAAWRSSGRRQRQNYSEAAAYADLSDDDDDDDDDSDVVYVPPRVAQKAAKTKNHMHFARDYSEEWEDRHWEVCELCRGGATNGRQLHYCQGCAVALHRECLMKFEKKHKLTEVPDMGWVLQCRHCVGRGTMNSVSRSYMTGRAGPLCEPFPDLKPPPALVMEDEPTAEERARQEEFQKAVDAVKAKLFVPDNVMFRCGKCLRPALYDDLIDPDTNDPEYEPANCLDCNAHRHERVDIVLGWRALSDDRLDTMEVPKSELPQNYLREYLVKWQEKSYGKAEWVLGSWLHGVSTSKKKNFDARQTDPITDQSEVILADWLIVEIVLDVRFEKDKNYEAMRFADEEDAVGAIDQVEHVLVKWRQVAYDDCTWDEPPPRPASDAAAESVEVEKWRAFEAAYKDWCRGFHVMVSKEHARNSIKLDDIPFSRLELKSQPKELVGGDLMPYQLEGLNWLYFKYYSRHPAILADEMGLGKTIQIISLLSVLHSQWSVGPFLIVAPNSTISNWKREFQKWAPQMRVAAYWGEKTTRQIVEDYEVVHTDVAGKPLKVHALVTSYNTVETDSALLKKYAWACLVVDEGQRLKNDEAILFKTLSEYRVNHRILLTGTPLQNNTKELFNLLQFLDPKKMRASELDARFDIERQDSLTELHQLLQPYFLRRTKAQVLKFLPKKNEVIVPVTMSTLQKSLMRSILSKNAELMRLVMSRASQGRPIQNYNNTSLGNILQQVRKILSHPFIYSPDIEEQVEDEKQTIINLTNACAKLQLLSHLLPALKARGHRVLVFCQYIMMLDILEDWLTAIGVRHCRIDGNTPSSERQESIDQFNRDPDITCFLLSTRAGGVGINLATADTVIIYDADFNPHQDLQAVARAHRIGQKNNVVVFTLVTRNTAEEKILQIGRKKLVLDQLIIENMATKEENVPYQEILSFGAAALFDEEAKDDLIYDTARVNALIDSSFAPEAFPNDDDEAAGEQKKDAFAFAKVWAGDTLTDTSALGTITEVNAVPQEDLWTRILEQRAEEAKRESEAKAAEASRARKARNVKDYNEARQSKKLEDMLLIKKPNVVDGGLSDVDNEEQAKGSVMSDGSEAAYVADDSSSGDSTDDEGYPEAGPNDNTPVGGRVPHVYATQNGATVPNDDLDEGFAAAALGGDVPCEAAAAAPAGTGEQHRPRVGRPPKQCKVCGQVHTGGQCQIRHIPLEICTLCNRCHFSGEKFKRRPVPCPALRSVDALREILQDLKASKEETGMVEQAKAYVRASIGKLQRQEREEKQKGQHPGSTVAATNAAIRSATGTNGASTAPPAQAQTQAQAQA